MIYKCKNEECHHFDVNREIEEVDGELVHPEAAFCTCGTPLHRFPKGQFGKAQRPTVSAPKEAKPSPGLEHDIRDTDPVYRLAKAVLSSDNPQHAIIAWAKELTSGK